MYSIGTYDRFVDIIKGRTEKGKVDFFGVLFCDSEQGDAKSYILNYLDVFNKKSSKHIDFYIPGYTSVNENKNHDFCIEYDEHLQMKECFKFNRKTYNDFSSQFSKEFEIDTPYVATLILIQYSSGKFSNSKKIVFTLDGSDKSIRESGRLFEDIFIAASNNPLEIKKIISEISTGVKTDIALTLGNTLLTTFTGLDLEPLYNKTKKYMNYKFK